MNYINISTHVRKTQLNVFSRESDSTTTNVRSFVHSSVNKTPKQLKIILFTLRQHSPPLTPSHITSQQQHNITTQHNNTTSHQTQHHITTSQHNITSQHNTTQHNITTQHHITHTITSQHHNTISHTKSHHNIKTQFLTQYHHKPSQPSSSSSSISSFT